MKNARQVSFGCRYTGISLEFTNELCVQVSCITLTCCHIRATFDKTKIGYYAFDKFSLGNLQLNLATLGKSTTFHNFKYNLVFNSKYIHSNNSPTLEILWESLSHFEPFKEHHI